MRIRLWLAAAFLLFTALAPFTAGTPVQPAATNVTALTVGAPIQVGNGPASDPQPISPFLAIGSTSVDSCGYSPNTFALPTKSGTTIILGEFATDAEPSDSQSNSWTLVVDNVGVISIWNASTKTTGTDIITVTDHAWAVDVTSGTTLAEGAVVEGGPVYPPALPFAAIALFTAYSGVPYPTSGGSAWNVSAPEPPRCGNQGFSLWAQIVSAGSTPELSFNDSSSAVNRFTWIEIPMAILAPEEPQDLYGSWASTGVFLSWTNSTTADVDNITIAAATSPLPSLSSRAVFYSCLVLGCANVSGYGYTTITGLASATTFYFQIEAWSMLGNSTWSNVVAVTVPYYNETPVILSASAQGPSSIFVSWDEAFSASNFTVAVSNVTPPYTASLVADSCHVVTCGAAGYFHWLSVTGLHNDTFYYVQVEAWSGATNSTWSNVLLVQTGQYVTPPVTVPAPASLSPLLLMVMFAGAAAALIAVVLMPKKKQP